MCKEKKKVTYGFIVGPSGIGKGFGVGQPLTEYFGADIFVTGDWCRLNRREFTLAGALAPDDLIAQATEEKYIHLGSPDRFLVDCPRNIGQAKRYIAMFNRWNPEAELSTFHITARKSVCVERIKHRANLQKRQDDARDDLIEKRLEFYFGKGGVRDTVIPYLKEKTKYRYIDGHMPLEDIRRFVREEHGPAIFDE